MKQILTFIFIVTTFVLCDHKPCVARDYKFGSTVCVCNRTYCDDLDPISKTAKGVVTVYETTKSGDRFKRTQLMFNYNTIVDTNPALNQTITIDRSKTYQKILGFGGAFTDSTGINIDSLPEVMQKRIIEDYFSER
ncbi:unnamed protein product, partial [Oppiella nova]